MLRENLSINVTPGGVPVIIHISQYDIGLRTFVFSPYTSHGTFTPDAAAAATLEGTKPDGNVIIHNCEYNASTGEITYTVQEQLAAVAGKVWSKLTLRDTSGNAIGYAAIIWMVDMAGVEDGAIASDSDISALQEFIAEFGTINAYKAALDGALAAVGGPYVASTVAQMTDRTKVYVYTGSQSGYTAGHWYYWNGSAWTDGGVYQAAAVETDKTLTVADMAADAKATGDAVTELKNDISYATGDISYATGDIVDNKMFPITNHGQAFPNVAPSYTTINIDTPVTSADWNSWKIPCAEGDIFTIYSQGGTTTAAWAFVDSSGTILQKSAGGATANRLIKTAPAGAAYLIVNDKSGSGRVYANKPFDDRVDEMIGELDAPIKLRQYNAVFYMADGVTVEYSDYTESPIRFVVGTHNYVLRLNNKTYTITPQNIIDAATVATIDVSDGVLTGTSYVIYFDVASENVKCLKAAASAAAIIVISNNPVLFYCHFKSIRCGLVVDWNENVYTHADHPKVETLQTDVNAIKRNLDFMPDYYVDHMVTKRQHILSNMLSVGKDGETFIFITDIHWERNDKTSPSLTAYLLDNLNINSMICGGDIINEGTKTAMVENMRAAITAFQHKNVLMPCAYGNHDNNGNGTAVEERFTVSEQYALMQKQAEKLVTYFSPTNFANQNWNFYYDVENTKTRFIVIDTGNNGTYNRFQYLADCLNDTPDGYSIVLIAHWLYQSGTVSETSRYLEMLCDSYNARESVTIPTKGTFDMTGGTGIVRLILAGHAHIDYNWYTANGIPVVVIDCDSGQRSNNTDTPYVSGTVTEQSFGVFTVGYTDGVVREEKIGRGFNQIFNSGVNEVAIGGTTTLTTDIDSPTWTSDNTSVATVVNGIVTGVSAGIATVKSVGTDTVENWYIIVS